MNQLVISAIGPDRPGIVDELTAAVTDRGGNIADSRMVNLRGRFAIIMLIEIDPNQAAGVRSDLDATAGNIGLTLSIQDTDSTIVEITPAIPYRVKIYSMDQVGLVHRVTHTLHMLQVNIEELDTRLEHGAHSGVPLFSMNMVISVPQTVPLRNVRHDLENLCADLNCDLDIDRV